MSGTALVCNGLPVNFGKIVIMVLQNKNAIIYGAGGSLSGAIAKALGGAGAKLMMKQESGVILSLTATPGGKYPFRRVAGFKNI